MNYRPEIDGLRAVAVVPVMLFHAQVAGFAGGFVGVDVFFVISGFLITMILIQDMGSGRFSLLKFYERRARRLLPALLFGLSLCLPFAWKWMLPDDLENFGQSLVATVLFSNNILLALTTGYWDLAAEFKPLLHTWSLGVEEQYYIVFPLLLLLWRSRNSLTLVLLTALFLLSFMLFLSPYYRSLNTTESASIFYMLPSRAWEILLGSFGAIYIAKGRIGSDQGQDQMLSLAGLFLVALGLFVPEKFGLLMEVRVIVTALGTLLLLVFARSNTWAQSILSNRIFVCVGIMSYSLYLFHQPLLAFTRVYLKDEPGLLFVLPLLLTFPLSYVSYRFIEKPFRDPARVSSKVAVSIFAVFGSGLVVAGYTLHARSGFPERLGDVSDFDNSIAYNQSAYRFKTDEFGGDGKFNVLVLGNSFARDIINILVENTHAASLNLVYQDDFYDCFRRNRQPLFAELYNASDVILLSSSELPTRMCVADDIAQAKGDGKRIFYIGTKHFGYNMNWIMRVPLRERTNLTNALLAETINHEHEMAVMVPPEHYISIIDLIASDHRVPITDDAGRLLSPDRTHVTQAGAIYIGAKVLGKRQFGHSLAEAIFSDELSK